MLEAAFQTDGAKDVIDLGAGTGACAIIAASLGHRVRAFDGSPEMLAVARSAARSAGIEFGMDRAARGMLPEIRGSLKQDSSTLQCGCKFGVPISGIIMPDIGTPNSSRRSQGSPAKVIQ